MLRHPLGRDVIFLSLQHIMASSLNLCSVCLSFLFFIACLPSPHRREAMRAIRNKRDRQTEHYLIKWIQGGKYVIQAGLPDLSQARLPNYINAAWHYLMPLDINRQDMYLPYLLYKRAELDLRLTNEFISRQKNQNFLQFLDASIFIDHHGNEKFRFDFEADSLFLWKILNFILAL